jgi:dynein heavy chain
MATNPFALQEWYEANETQLGQLTELVRGKLTSLQRKIIVALVTTDVHARDIVEGLVKDNVSSIYDFAW